MRVTSIVPFFVMKGMALDERLKVKDGCLGHILLHPGLSRRY
jgi:hypothetical protein